jgi:hypothetical protein
MTTATLVRIRCDQCELLRVNGIVCHETGCPNAGKHFDPETSEWTRYVSCRECGELQVEGESCCEDEAAHQMICEECGREYYDLNAEEITELVENNCCPSDDCPGRWERRGHPHPTHSFPAPTVKTMMDYEQTLWQIIADMKEQLIQTWPHHPNADALYLVVDATTGKWKVVPEEQTQHAFDAGYTWQSAPVSCALAYQHYGRHLYDSLRQAPLFPTP